MLHCCHRQFLLLGLVKLESNHTIFKSTPLQGIWNPTIGRLFCVFGDIRLVFCCEAPTPYSIVISTLKYPKKDSIASKVDMKLPFAMLLMTPHMAQIKFFPNFCWISKTTFAQLCTWNYMQLLLWRVAFIIDQPSYTYSLQVNELMYIKKTNKACEELQQL
jgi:hypothetical protein